MNTVLKISILILFILSIAFFSGFSWLYYSGRINTYQPITIKNANNENVNFKVHGISPFGKLFPLIQVDSINVYSYYMFCKQIEIQFQANNEISKHVIIVEIGKTSYRYQIIGNSRFIKPAQDRGNISYWRALFSVFYWIIIKKILNFVFIIIGLLIIYKLILLIYYRRKYIIQFYKTSKKYIIQFYKKLFIKKINAISQKAEQYILNSFRLSNFYLFIFVIFMFIITYKPETLNIVPDSFDYFIASNYRKFAYPLFLRIILFFSPINFFNSLYTVQIFIGIFSAIFFSRQIKKLLKLSKFDEIIIACIAYFPYLFYYTRIADSMMSEALAYPLFLLILGLMTNYYYNRDKNALVLLFFTTIIICNIRSQFIFLYLLYAVIVLGFLILKKVKLRIFFKILLFIIISFWLTIFIDKSYQFIRFGNYSRTPDSGVNISKNAYFCF